MAMLLSCHPDDEAPPDVSDIDVETKIFRYDSLLYHLDNASDLYQVRKENDIFYDLYFGRILNFKEYRNVDSLWNNIESMLQAETFRSLRPKITSQYRSISDLKSEWNRSMKYYSYYFNTDTVPDLYFCLTEFALGTFIFPLNEQEDAIGVSLDMFLGDSIDYTLMARVDPAFSDYHSRTFNRDHLIKKSLDALIVDLVPVEKDMQFISQLVQEGKKVYLAKKLLPYTPDTILWEWTPDQWKWVQDNEWNLYSHIVTNDLFYSTNISEYQKLLNPAPSSYGMPPESPGRAVFYIGYQFVKSYTNRHRDLSMEEVLNIPGEELFKEAKYRPRR